MSDTLPNTGYGSACSLVSADVFTRSHWLFFVRSVLPFLALYCRRCYTDVRVAKRNRRAPNLRSPLALVPSAILVPTEIDGVPVYMHPSDSHAQRRVGPDTPQWKLPRSDWPVILQCVDQGETYRQIASSL